MTELFEPARFLGAQAAIYDLALQALTAGKLPTRWVAPIFPPRAILANLVDEYALPSLAAARAYLEHDVLGLRYRQCVAKVIPHLDKTPVEVFGAEGAYTLESSITLFSRALTAGEAQPILSRWFPRLD